MIYGLDLCSLQGHIDAVAMKASGIDFAYVKATQYAGGVDRNFHQYAQQLKNAGITVGAYHFAWQGGDPVAQITHFYEQSAGLGSNPGELPPAIDWEFCHNIPVGVCTDWLLRAVRKCNALWYPRSAGERKCVVYTYPWFASSHQPLPKELAQESILWLAGSPHYTDARKAGWEPSETWHPGTVQPWEKAVLAQYSGNGGMPVPGVSVDCDRDLFMGSGGDFDALCGVHRPVDAIEGPAAETIEPLRT